MVIATDVAIMAIVYAIARPTCKNNIEKPQKAFVLKVPT